MATRTITTFTIKAAPDGSWNIPEEILEDLGVKPGDTVVADRTRAGQVLFRTVSPDRIAEESELARTAAMVRAHMQNHLPEGTSIEDELEAWDRAIEEAVLADYEASMNRGDDT